MHIHLNKVKCPKTETLQSWIVEKLKSPKVENLKVKKVKMRTQIKWCVSYLCLYWNGLILPSLSLL